MKNAGIVTPARPAQRVRACLLASCLHIASSCADQTALVAEYRRPTSSGMDGSSDRSAAGGSDGDARARAEETGERGSLGTSGADVGPREESIGIAGGDRESFCAGQGPALRSAALANADDQVCTAGIGRRLFSFALCTCGDTTLTGTAATIDAFDSRQGPFELPELGAALGSNGSLRVSEIGSRIGGTAIVAGSAFEVTGPAGFVGDVKSNASIDIPGLGIGFERDLWVNGDIRGVLAAPVRDIYQSPGHSGAEMLSRSGMLYLQPVTVDPPCPCDDTALLDIPGLVASAQTNNDNAALGLSAAALGARLNAGSPPSAFTCGRFAMPSLAIERDVASQITGRTALFVDGDLSVGADFGAALPAGAELDVFVSGALRLTGPGHLGTQDRPWALRLYIGGSEALTITSANPIAAQLYAPRVPLSVESGTAAIFGSLFAAQLDARGLFAVHYDRAIAYAGEECTSSEPTPATLLRAGSCQPCPNGLAAVEGACGACTRDADCCEPTVCVDGICQPLILPDAMSE